MNSELIPYEIGLIEEALEAYTDQLVTYDDMIERVMDDVTVTQELDELINNNRLKRRSISLIQSKIHKGRR